MAFPENLGRLRRIRRLGAGGFASVWLYHDAELDSPVAVKALADNWAQDADIRTRFVEESRLLRRASSDHIVSVHDVGVTADDIPYFVMTYADRGSAADLIAEGGRPTPDELVDVINQAARGLTDLHAQGIVHRDVKPANLLFISRPDGGRRVLVADLGVAKTLATDSGATLHVGTPAYGAPEQARLLDEPRADRRVLCPVVGQCLDRDRGVKLGVVIEPDRGEAAGAEPASASPSRTWRSRRPAR